MWLQNAAVLYDVLHDVFATNRLLSVFSGANGKDKLGKV